MSVEELQLREWEINLSSVYTSRVERAAGAIVNHALAAECQGNSDRAARVAMAIENALREIEGGAA